MLWPWQRRSSPVTVDRPRASPAGWAFLPPLQRQVSDEPPLMLAPTFESWLPTRAAPQRMGSMGHLVAPGAPAGTIAGTTAQLGAPVQRAIAADLTLRPPSWNRPRPRSTTPTTTADVALGAAAPVDSETNAVLPQPTEDRMPLAAVSDESTAERPPDAADTDLGADMQFADPMAEDASGSEANLLTELTPAGTPESLQREPEPLSQPREATAPPVPLMLARRLGLGAPVKPPVLPAMPIVQRADTSIPTATVSSAAAQPHTSSSPSGAAGTTSTSEPRGHGPVDDPTSETTVETIASMPAPEGLLGATLDTATDAREPHPEVAAHGGTPLPLPSVQRRSENDIDKGSARANPTGESPTGEGLATDDAMSQPAHALPLSGREPRETVVGDASDIGHRFEPGADRAGAQTIGAQTVPLIAQRALAPMLSPVTTRRPAEHLRPRATVLMDTDGRPAALTTTSDPSGRTAVTDTDTSASPRDSNPASRGVVTWLQRLVGSGAIESPDTAFATPRSARAHAPSDGYTGPGADVGRTSSMPAIQRAVVDARISARVSNDTSRGGLLPWLHRLVASGEPESPDTASATPGAGTSASASASSGTRLASVLPSPAPRQSARAHGPSDGYTGPGADAGWTSSTPAMQRALSSAFPASTRPPLLSGAPLGPAPARIDVETVATQAADRTPMPVAGATRDWVAQRYESPDPAEPPTPPASTPPPQTDSVQRVDVPEPAAAPPASAATSIGPFAAPPLGSPSSIETLAGQLYGPIVRRLKTELLLDRERRGFRIDGV